MSFSFTGALHSSKSLVNRLLILQHIFSDLQLSYDSTSEDVKNLEQLFEDYNQGKTEFFMGDGGTTFRFFSFWISMQEGVWRLRLGEQLARRPHDAILHILRQVGIRAEFQSPELLEISGGTWDEFETVEIDLAESTQFLTGFLLSASQLRSEFTIKTLNAHQSSGYEEITFGLLQNLGFQIQAVMSEEAEITYRVQPPDAVHQRVQVGADWSSVFYISLFAFLGADIKITNIDVDSPEPDREGLQILSECGLNFGLEEKSLIIKPSAFKMRKENFDFRKNPDLFPGFCALLAWALPEQEEVVLQYPWQLKIKESDRLNKSLEFFKIAGLSYSFQDSNTLVVQRAQSEPKEIHADFDTAMDHRMLMSAMFLKHAGWGLELHDFDSHRKSFPEFMEIIHG